MQEVEESSKEIVKNSCVSLLEMHYYFGTKTGFALHIDDLKIYDKPKELSEFYRPLSKKDLENGNFSIDCGGTVACMDYPEGGEYCETCRYGGRKPLTKAPQNFVYVEELE